MTARFLIAVGALLLLEANPAPAEAARIVIELKDMHFGAPPAHLKVGDVLAWKNSDIFQHTATARMGGFDLDLPPGKTAEVTLKKAGPINVYCRYHPNMTLRLTVEKAG
jgi:plastocyanin